MERRKTQAMASHSAIFLLLSIFTFVFLGSEYLYVNMVSRIVEESQTVITQNYALGVNALGFLIYPLITVLSARGTRRSLYFPYRSSPLSAYF